MGTFFFLFAVRNLFFLAKNMKWEVKKIGQQNFQLSVHVSLSHFFSNIDRDSISLLILSSKGLT